MPLLEHPPEKPFQNAREWRHQRVAYEVVVECEHELRAMGEEGIRKVLAKVRARDDDLASALETELRRQHILPRAAA